MQPFGLVLVPEPAMAREVTAMAQKLLPTVGPVRSMLGEGALPHVSLTHVRSSLSAEQIWHEVEASFPLNAIDMTFLGIRFHGYNKTYLVDEPGSGLTVYLQVLFTEVIRNLRELTTKTAWFTTGEVAYMGAGETLDPHFTLGSTRPGSGARVAGSLDIPVDLLNITVPARLALGPIGPFGVLEGVLFGGWGE
jgi:hypothetical protein